MITTDELKKILRYEPETGLFYRISAPLRQRRLIGTIAGTKHSTGYIAIHVNGTIFYAHRLAWLYMTGDWPKKYIDHINRDRADNRFENLREADTAQNNINSDPSRANVSGYTGVCWIIRRERWLAQIKVNGKQICLGYHHTKEDAIAARKAGERKYFGEFGHG